ncbi:FHA domain-containing protein [Thermodesulfobacteriota bacterium]
MLKIYISDGPEAGKSYEFDDDIIQIGRAIENDVQIRDPLISRNHLSVLLKDQEYRITDMQSANGTFVGNEKISPNIEIDIEEGVPIRIGVSVLSLGKPVNKETGQDFDSTLIPEEQSSKKKESEGQRYMEYENNVNLIGKVSSLLKESLELNEVFNKIMNHILDLLVRTDRVFIILFDTETMDISEVISKSRGRFILGDIDYSHDIVDQVIEEKSAVMVSDQYIEFDINLSATSELPKTGSAICVPMISRAQMRGLIYVDTIGKAHGFRSSDFETLKTLGSIIAIIIENSFLLKNV